MSRRDQIRMTDPEIREFLREKKTIILNSINPDGFPHPMPMWFAVDDEMVIRMTTFRKSQKILNLQRDSRCSLLVESGLEYQELKGVVIYGRAELSEDLDEIIATLLAAAGQEAPGDADSQKAMQEVMTKTASKRTLIRVRPETVVSWDHSKLGGVY